MSYKIFRVKNALREGLPPDAVTLQDIDNTFGARRQDTLEVVVAAGTAMIQDAVDPKLWTYQFNDPVEGVSYEWVARIVFGSEVIYAEAEFTHQPEPDCAALLNVSQVDALLAIHVPSAELADWTGLTSADKGVYICRAQGMIDAGTWDGTLWSDTQAYSFPRKDDDGDLIGVENEADEDNPLAPLAVREALALLAFSFVNRADIWEAYELRISGGLASHSAGGISKAYAARTGRSDAHEALRAVASVWSRLGQFWRRGARIV